MGFSDWLILGFVAIGLFAGNQFRYWHRLPLVGDLLTEEHSGELRRVPAYVYGVAWILAGVALWCVQHPEHWPAFGFLVSVAVAAGIGTLIPRIAERDAELQNHQADKAELEKELAKWRGHPPQNRNG